MKKIIGTVFAYENKNFCPFENVVVSDGRNVVKTNAKGEFSLDGHEKAVFVSVTTPSGCKVLGKHYQEIGEAKDEYTFILEKTPRSDECHRFIQISDTEIGASKAGPWMDHLKNLAAIHDVDFIIHTGDLCRKEGILRHAIDMSDDSMGCKVYYTIGNHDHCEDEYGEFVYEKVNGPVWFSFEYGNTHYMVTSLLSGDYKPRYTLDDMLCWMKNDIDCIEGDKKIIIFNHSYSKSLDYKFELKDKSELDLKAKGLVAWLFGHFHYNFVHNRDGVFEISTARPDCGGIDQAVNALRIVDVDSETNISTRLVNWCHKDNFSSFAYMSGNQVSVHVSARESESKVAEVLCVVDAVELTLDKVSESNYSCKFDSSSLEKGQSFKTIIKLRDGTSIEMDTEVNKAIDWISCLDSSILFSAPIIHNDAVYIATCDDNVHNKSAVYKLNLCSGEIVWKFKTDYSVKNNICLQGENLYFQDSFGNIYSVSASDGTLIWKAFNKSEDSYTSEGLYADEKAVYFASCSHIAGFDIETGSKLWETKIGGGCSNVSRIQSSGDIIVCGSQWNCLVGINKHSGDVVWTQKNDKIRMRSTTPLIENNIIYLASSNAFYLIDILTGEIIKEKDCGVNFDTGSQPLIFENNIYVATPYDGIISLNKDTLDEQWRFSTRESLVFTSPYTTIGSKCVEGGVLLKDGVLYFGASDGYVYGIDAKTGDKVFEMNNGVPIIAKLCIVQDDMVVADMSGKLVCLKI